MTKESDLLERRIEHIHSLIEQKGSVVTWNERLPDPDNPNRTRQLDVTIRRDGKLTIVECRIHKGPQDVKWIEELIGRRVSLRADTVIAVSSSGFTSGAVRKAIAFGIILRDFETLTSQEIRDWGKKRQVKLEFYQFTNNVLHVTLPVIPAPKIAMTDSTGAPFNWMPLLSQLKSKLNDDRTLRTEGAADITVRNITAKCSFGGLKASQIDFVTRARRILRNVSTTSVVAYADPADKKARQALLGKLDLGESEIVESYDQASVALDVSKIKYPKN